MLYYYSRNLEFNKESSKEYKSKKGAIEKFNKENDGAVFDENGNLIISKVDTKSEEQPQEEPEEQPQEEPKEQPQEEPGEQPQEEPEEQPQEEPEEQPQEEPKEQPQEEPEEQPQEEPKEQPQEEPEEQSQEFDVQTICDVLIIRAGAGKEFKNIGYIMEYSSNKTNHTIVEGVNGWGRLKNEAGWVSLALTKRV